MAWASVDGFEVPVSQKTTSTHSDLRLLCSSDEQLSEQYNACRTPPSDFENCDLNDFITAGDEVASVSHSGPLHNLQTKPRIESHSTNKSCQFNEHRENFESDQLTEFFGEQLRNDNCDLSQLPEFSHFRPLNNYRCHGRAILVFEQAQDIFRYKSISFAKERDKAGILARVYGVSVKTIRDIWVGRTWYRATFNLDPSKPITPERLQRRAGRPKGAKDSTPRARKLASSINEYEGDFDASTLSSTPGQRIQHGHANLTPREARNAHHGPPPSVHSTEAGVATERERDAHIRASGWLDFPTGIPAEGFQDPFFEDWASALLRASTAH